MACIHTDWPINAGGYGCRAGVYAHRNAYELAFGEIPEGLVVRHKCDTPSCVNPDHLELGTQAQNIRDMHERGRNVNPPILKGERNPKAKLKDFQVIEIYESSDPHTACAKRYGVTPEMVGLIRRGKAWQHVTLGLKVPE